MSRFWEIVFCLPLLFRRHVCLSKLKHSPSRELPLTARKTVFSHLKCFANIRITDQIAFLCVHAPRVHTYLRFLPSLLPSATKTRSVLHFFAYPDITFAHILVFPACTIEVQHINKNSPQILPQKSENVRPHSSQSSRENATPSSATSPLAIHTDIRTCFLFEVLQ